MTSDVTEFLGHGIKIWIEKVITKLAMNLRSEELVDCPFVFGDSLVNEFVNESFG